MGRINFTDEHKAKLYNALAIATLNGVTINGPMGQIYSTWDLVHNLSISSLRTLSAGLAKKKAALSVEDEWIENPNTDEIALVDSKIELISLIIGYKLKSMEDAENAAEKVRLTKQLDELVQSQKSPAELISDLQKKIEELG